jgi:hypothetical protein
VENCGRGENMGPGKIKREKALGEGRGRNGDVGREAGEEIERKGKIQ